MTRACRPSTTRCAAARRCPDTPSAGRTGRRGPRPGPKTAPVSLREADVNPIGANTWIWTSPLADAGMAELAPKLAAWGFDLAELPVENVGDWDPARAAEVLSEHGLGATVCAVMPPGRELVAADRETVAATQAYLRSCVDAAATVGSGAGPGPLCPPAPRSRR